MFVQDLNTAFQLLKNKLTVRTLLCVQYCVFIYVFTSVFSSNSIRNPQKRNRCSCFQCVSYFFSGEVSTDSGFWTLITVFVAQCNRRNLCRLLNLTKLRTYTLWRKYIKAGVFRLQLVNVINPFYFFCVWQMKFDPEGNVTSFGKCSLYVYVVCSSSSSM